MSVLRMHIAGRAWAVVALVVVMACCIRSAHADLATLEAAQAAYDRGIEQISTKPAEARAAFAESAALLQQLVDGGADASDLHYNLGNAYVQAGDLGRGIASYLRARQITPFAPHVLANLASARTDAGLAGSAGGGVGVGAISDGSQYAWWRLLPESTRQITAIVAWIVAWSLVALAILRPSKEGTTGNARSLPLRALRTIAFVLAILAGLSVATDRWLAATRPLAVIVERDVVLRKGNGEGFAPQVAEKLTPGVECLILEARPDWLRVRLGDGTEGWVRDTTLVRVARSA